MAFLNLNEEGEACTEGEYRQRRVEAGFVDYQRKLLEEAMSLVSSTKE